MASLGTYEFRADLVKFAQALDLNVQTLTRRLAGELWNDITIRTPVKTGRARSGWAMALGTIPDYVPPVVATGVRPPPPTPDWTAITGTQSVFLINNLDYIEALEDGHSQRAPAGMVKVSLQALETKIQAILSTLDT